jgi:hypothetical protein
MKGLKNPPSEKRIDYVINQANSTGIKQITICTNKFLNL